MFITAVVIFSYALCATKELSLLPQVEVLGHCEDVGA